jgi:hypothetical protein
MAKGQRQPRVDRIPKVDFLASLIQLAHNSRTLCRISGLGVPACGPACSRVNSRALVRLVDVISCQSRLFSSCDEGIFVYQRLHFLLQLFTHLSLLISARFLRKHSDGSSSLGRSCALCAGVTARTNASWAVRHG